MIVKLMLLVVLVLSVFVGVMVCIVNFVVFVLFDV